MLVGYDRNDMSQVNQVVASDIFDGGFQEFSPLTKGDVVTFRRNGPDLEWLNSSL